MNEHDLKHIIEATLLAAARPVTTQQLLDLFDERERPTPELLQAALDLLTVDYETRGIELIQVASGWRIQVRARCVDIVSRLWQERPSRYSRALLETLALVAYRQPITRSEIEEIRGVSISSTIMRTMQERNWIRILGHREVPGRPELLGTTREFLDYFGLKSLDQLPTLAELRDVENIGVQLELPGGELPQATSDAAAEPEAVSGEASAESTAEAVNGDAELSAEAGAAADAAEVPAGDDPEESSETEAAGDDVELSAEMQTAGDDDELLADAEEGEEMADDNDEDSDVAPTLVASESEEDDGRAVSDPAEER